VTAKKYPTAPVKSKTKFGSERKLRCVIRGRDVMIEEEVGYEYQTRRNGPRHIGFRWEALMLVTEEHCAIMRDLEIYRLVKDNIDAKAYSALHRHEHPEEYKGG
jgi:hypothetical protein